MALYRRHKRLSLRWRLKIKALDKAGIRQKLGSTIPLDIPFRDENGQTVTLKKYFQDKPVILIPVYYECPMLCSLILNGMLKMLQELKFDVGREFQIVTFSFNPKETPSLALAKKKNYLKEYGRSGAHEGWAFLTGTQEAITELTENIGFDYTYDEQSGQYAHASSVLILTPQGKIARYFTGIEFSPFDFRLALVEASRGKIGSPIDQIMLLCFHYNPLVGKYSFFILNVLRVAGTLTVLILIGALIKMTRSNSKTLTSAR